MKMTDHGPRRIAFVYAAFGFLWILVSDTIAVWVARTPRDLARIQTYKGWIFVGLTTALVYLLLRLYARRRNHAQCELIRANEEIVAALREKELLVRELRHRVMNNLQSVTSLLNLTADHEDPEETRKRLWALSTCHEVALSFDDLARIAASDYLKRLLETLDSSRPGRSGAITIESVNSATQQPILTINHAIPIGMFLYELYRQPSMTDEVSTYAVTIVDTGEELRISAPARLSGFSATLCEAWGTQAGGTVTHGDAATVLVVPRDGTPTKSWQ